MELGLEPRCLVSTPHAGPFDRMATRLCKWYFIDTALVFSLVRRDFSIWRVLMFWSIIWNCSAYIKKEGCRISSSYTFQLHCHFNRVAGSLYIENLPFRSRFWEWLSPQVLWKGLLCIQGFKAMPLTLGLGPWRRTCPVLSTHLLNPPGSRPLEIAEPKTSIRPSGER